MAAAPADWKGSDLRSRSEIVKWLADQGGEVSDKTGLIVGRMRTELGKGRALTQLLADMEADGMIAREIRGRRTFSVRLLDDWGLVLKPVPEPFEDVRGPEHHDGDGSGHSPDAEDGLDLSALAEMLLATVIKKARASEAPAIGREAKRLADRLRRAEQNLSALEKQLAQAKMAERTQSEKVQQLEQMVVTLESNLRVAQSKPKARTVKLEEALSADDRAALARLMAEVPRR